MKWLENLIEKFKGRPSQTEQNLENVNRGFFNGIDTPVEETKKETDFEVAKRKFNPSTDLLVISHVAASMLPKEDQDWLETMGNKIVYFGADSLINVAIVRAGYGLNW